MKPSPAKKEQTTICKRGMKTSLEGIDYRMQANVIHIYFIRNGLSDITRILPRE